MATGTPFWQQKMRTYFRRFDIDKSGTVEEDDFDKLAQKLVDMAGNSGGRTDQLRANVKLLWSSYWSKGDSDGDGQVTEAEFLANVAPALSDTASTHKALESIFDAIDSSGDGEISLEEFTTFFQVLGLDAAAAKASFSAIDVNGDGGLNKGEFVSAGEAFFTSADEAAPSRLFWGPLV